MLTVQERSAKTFLARFLDESGSLTTPSVARWRLKSITTGGVIVDWTSITPAPTANILITAEQNTIRSGKSFEFYELVVQSDHNDPSLQQSKALQYRVANIKAVDD